MENNHWTTESWGSEYPPLNYQAILDAANDLIDDYADSIGEDDAYHADTLVRQFSDDLWMKYCDTDMVGGVKSVWGWDDPAMVRYIVVDDGHDSYSTVCTTPEEANQEARSQWEHLTKQEQKSRTIYAAVVTLDDLADGAIDEYTGDVDWTCWENCNDFPGAFHSNPDSDWGE